MSTPNSPQSARFIHRRVGDLALAPVELLLPISALETLAEEVPGRRWSLGRRLLDPKIFPHDDSY